MKAVKGGKHPVKKNETHEMLLQIADMLKEIDKPKPNTTGISYSSLLLQLIKPYQQDSENISFDELEYLLDIGMAAWNLAVYKKKSSFMYETYLEALTNDEMMDAECKKLLHQMEADKGKLFGEHNNMILEDFEITKGKNGDSIVNVISKPLDSFIAESVSGAFPDEGNEVEDDDEMPPYILPVVNRNVVFVKPKAPFLEWIKKIYLPQQPPVLKHEGNIYLVPEYESEKGVIKFLKKNFDRMFCSELWSWDMYENKWPSNRNYKVFTEWFEIKLLPMLYDMGNNPLRKE